ncbi:MAG: type II secretion system secretin GspD, partial [Alphaproteobacteria bacterium]|nr:type II secretion system secretin GspD [Alphaproteobacteria bacterium]
MRRIEGPHRRSRVVTRVRALAFAVAISAATAACNFLTTEDDPRRPPDVFDKVRAVDLTPRFPKPIGTTATGPADGARPSTYFGTGTEGAAGPSPGVTGAQRAPSGEGYELNFENTPVGGVVKVVLGDILGYGYLIDPRVQGTITLASGRPVPRDSLLFVLENALKLGGATLVRDKRGYMVVPASDAIGTGKLETADGTEAGFGITVVPLQYVSAAALSKLVDSFAVKANTIRIDPARNLVLIQGSGADRAAAAETVLSFDADWMRGQSVGIFPVRNSAPDAVIADLEKIMDSGENGLSQSLVKLQPIARQNAIMVITSKPALLRTAATWIARLDKSDTASTGVRVYHVKYGDAKQIAGLLNDMFGGGRGTGLDSPTNQIAPGSGIATSASGSSTIAPQGGIQIPSARTQPGQSSSDSRLSGGAGGAGSFPAQNANDAVASRLGPFGGRQSPGTNVGAFPGSQGANAGPNALFNVRITADTVNNTLLIYANQENYRIIEQTLRQIDRPQLQVAIDATIAEITLNDNLTYGVQFFLQGHDVGLHDLGTATLSTSASAIISQAFPGFNFLYGGAAQPTLILNALRQVSDVKVLSTPSVVVLDNQVATLQVGDQVPVATASATVLSGTNNPVVNTIDYRNTGVILRVVPRINSNGNVLLDIEQEISNAAAGSAGSLTPTISQRRVKSAIAVANGQTVLLAGLISENSSTQRQGLPLVDQLGEFGKLFGNTNKTKQRTELIIFIRPQIIRDGVDAMHV